MMRLTLRTSTPGEVYRDCGSPRSVLSRLARACPGGTVIQAATIAHERGKRAAVSAVRVLQQVAASATAKGDTHTASSAMSLALRIDERGFLETMLLGELHRILTRRITRRRAA